MMTGPTPIVADHATKRFGSETAVESISLSVSAGTILGLIGPSGCGKTTTVRLLTGSYRPTEGFVRLFGHDPTELSTHEKRLMGYLPQIPIQLPALTVWENLNFSASLYGMGLRHRRRRLKDALALVELEGHEHKRVDEISGGMQRRLAVAATLAHEPGVLFLDEPTAGIDPILRRKFWDRFRELRDGGRTFLITTQYVGEAAYCDVVAVMSEGRLIATGAPEELRRRACGGEVVELTTAGHLTDGALVELGRLAYVRGPVRRAGARVIQLTVDDASRAQPDLIDELRRHGVEVASSAEATPDYDDVFVRLIEQDRAQHVVETDAA